MEENKTFHLYASYNVYNSSLLRDNENILGHDNDCILGNKLDETNKILCTGSEHEKKNKSIIDKVHIALDIIGCFDPTGISDVTNAVIYLCQGDIESMTLSLVAVFLPIPAGALKGGVKYAKKVTTKNGYVFWSGGNDARKAAEAFAKENGFTTFEMTSKGQQVERKVNNKYIKHLYKQEYEEAIKIARKKGLNSREDIDAYVRYHMNDIRDLVEEAKYGASNQLYMLLDDKRVVEWGAKQFSMGSKQFAEEAARAGKEIHNFRKRKYNPTSIWIKVERPIIKQHGKFSKVHLVR